MKYTISAFTLVELLVVIVIISILAALIFPVFGAARQKGYQNACLSNLHQIGTGVLLYASDYDDLLPWASELSEYDPAIPKLKIVLTPYLKSDNVWHCPADTGMHGGMVDVPTSDVPCYRVYGSSYWQWTQLIKAQQPLSSFQGQIKAGEYVSVKTDVPVASSNIIFLFDGDGKWHQGKRNSWFLDGHVANVTEKYFSDLFWGYIRFQGK